MSGNWVDVVLVVASLLVALLGWRAGFISTVAGFAGFIGGALAGAWLVPQLLLGAGWPNLLEGLATVAGMLLLGLLGQAVLGLAGRAVRRALDFRPVRFLDSLGGMVVSTVAFLLSAWLVLSVAASLPRAPGAQEIRESRAFPVLEALLAGPATFVLANVRELLAYLDLPSLPLNPATLPPVEDGGEVEITAEVRQVAEESVLKVTTTSSRCGLTVQGSALAISGDHLATNAHVVAGAGRITVRPYGGRQYGARLVYTDRRTDLAILYVPGLDVPAPSWRPSAPRGAEAAIVGYPGGGALTIRGARVRGELTLADESGAGDREVVVVQGLVIPGNSGGPILDLDGQVLGLVFANSSIDDRTGFALAPDEVLPVITETRTLTSEVSSGSCPTPSD